MKEIEGNLCKELHNKQNSSFERLVNQKLKESRSIGENLNDFQAIVNWLAAVNCKVDDEIQALMLMSLLSENWKTLMVALNNSNSDGMFQWDW